MEAGKGLLGKVKGKKKKKKAKKAQEGQQAQQSQGAGGGGGGGGSAIPGGVSQIVDIAKGFMGGKA